MQIPEIALVINSRLKAGYRSAVQLEPMSRVRDQISGSPFENWREKGAL